MKEKRCDLCDGSGFHVFDEHYSVHCEECNSEVSDNSDEWDTLAIWIDQFLSFFRKKK